MLGLKLAAHQLAGMLPHLRMAELSNCSMLERQQRKGCAAAYRVSVLK